MGRQPFLTRLALGRSAYEPLEQTSSYTPFPPPIQDGPNEDASDQARTQTQPRNMQERLNVGYSQQYDDRGHPCNPFAQYWASEMRQAQNDVLAAVGVVKRNDDQEQEHRQLDVQEVAKRLDFEKSVGATLETSFVALLICTKWCFDSFRLRLMVFPYPPNLSICDILYSERRILGNTALCTAGLTSYVFYHSLLEPIEIFIDHFTASLHRIVLASVSSRAQRNRWGTHIANLGVALNAAARLLLSPLFMYSRLQQCHLIPASPKLPNWRSLIPFSRFSPFQPFPSPATIFRYGLWTWIWSTLAFPTTVYLVLFAIDYFDEFSATELPQPDIIAPKDRDSRAEPFDFQRENYLWVAGLGHLSISPHVWARRIRDRVLKTLGWVHRPRRLSERRKALQQDNSLPEPPSPNPGSHGTATPSSEAPSTYTDAFGNLAPSADYHPSLSDQVRTANSIMALRESIEARSRGVRYQRVSDLSTAPAKFLTTQIRLSLTEWSALPREAMMMRGLAWAFLSASSGLTVSQRGDAASLKASVYPVFVGPVVGGVLGLLGWHRLSGLGNSSTRVGGLGVAGLYLGRVVLVSMAQVAAGFCLWGLQWVLVRNVGKRFSGWGKI